MKIYTKSTITASLLLAFVCATVVAVVSVAVSTQTGPAGKARQEIVSAEDRLVVHEWGTFTSIAGKDGVALEWRPLNGSSDLPKFVHTIGNRGPGLRHQPTKGEMSTLIRMETPVLFFYSENETEVSVKVEFPRGKITEWYPQARSVGTDIDWGQIKVMPGAALNLPVDNSDSHYYPARETDAAPVQVCGTGNKPDQQEKFLFYRGVGNFELPLSARLVDNKIILKNTGAEQIARVIVFENRNGKIGYRIYDSFSGEMTDARPTLDQKLDSLVPELKQAIMATGLYEKEADAMIKTWRSSWFEPGMRVFYVLPRPTIDTVLPITITPQPAELVRVLIGRAEIITPEMEKTVQRQVSLLDDKSPQVREAAMETIRKYGRFYEPILKSTLQHETDPAIRRQLTRLIEAERP